MTARPRSDAGKRGALRLPTYDYAGGGAYFITICTHNRECIFGEIEDDLMHLNQLGLLVATEWMRSGGVRREVELDAFIVMPNHLHAIVFLQRSADSARTAAVGASGRSPRRARGTAPGSLGALVAGFKASVTTRINALRQTPGAPVWQRNYYEHVIRNDRSLDAIRRYIADNPAKWPDDEENPARRRGR